MLYRNYRIRRRLPVKQFVAAPEQQVGGDAVGGLRGLDRPRQLKLGEPGVTPGGDVVLDAGAAQCADARPDRNQFLVSGLQCHVSALLICGPGQGVVPGVREQPGGPGQAHVVVGDRGDFHDVQDVRLVNPPSRSRTTSPSSHLRRVASLTAKSSITRSWAGSSTWR